MELPEKLYHYTDVNALLGILHNSEVWMTDCLYCNDSSEFSKAKEMLLEKWEKDEEKKLVDLLISINM